MRFVRILLAVAGMGFGLCPLSGSSDTLWQPTFSNAYQRAVAKNIPLFVYTGNSYCDYCDLLKAAVHGTEFAAWQAKHPFLFVDQDVPYSPDWELSIDAVKITQAYNPDFWMAFNWCRGMLVWDEEGIRREGRPDTRLNGYPYVRVYWAPKGGTVRSVSFTGRSSYDGMGWIVPKTEGMTLAQQLIAVLEQYVGDWDATSFLVSDTEGSRLEAVIGETTFVDVPLTRTADAGLGVVTNVVSANYGTAGTHSATVIWGADDLTAKARITLPSASQLKAGAVTLSLANLAGKVHATNMLHLVSAAANSTANPHWIGEKAVGALPYGEWTMDLVTATNQVAKSADEAYTVVLFSGVLWCPWCKGMDAGLLSQPVFKDFVKAKNAALVVLDNPKRPTGDLKKPNGQPPTLLRYDETTAAVSGASYLSRHMISEEAAETILQRNHDLGYTDQGKGGFRQPGSARVGYPTFYLLKKDGSIVGTLDYVSTTVTNIVEEGGTVVTNINKYYFDTATNMQRVYDLFNRAGGYVGGDFMVSATNEHSRLQAEVGRTSRVYVPFKRTQSAATVCATNTLNVYLPNGTRLGTQKTLEWKAGTREASLPVDMDWNAGLSAGDRLVLELSSQKEGIVSSNLIEVVAQRKPSVDNPHFVGAFAPADLPWGEWTLDYAAATNKAATAGGHVFALFSGVLWCPYCVGLESSLLCSDEFTQWAKDNKVALVLFDQGLASTPATAAATNKARLMSYEEGIEHVRNVDSVSGASYLSRKGLDGLFDRRVAACIDLVTEKTSLWRTPGSTGARLGNPTMLLVRGDTVVGRFSAYRDSQKVYDVTENIGRLNDLLKLESKADDLDNYASTTRKSLTVGRSVSPTLQISDNVDWYCLSNMPNGNVTFTVGDKTKVRDVSLALACDGQTVASGTETLTVSGVVASAGLWQLKVSAYAKSGLYCPSGASTVFSATVASEACLVPTEEPVTIEAIAAAVKMELKAGQAYRLDGIAAVSLDEHFVEQDAKAGVYVAESDGVVELTVSQPTVTYALACPGTLGFAAARITRFVPGTGSPVEIEVCRTGGTDGRLSACLSLNESKTDPLGTNIVSWCGTTNLVWEAGDDTPCRVRLPVDDSAVFYEDVSVAFRIEGVGASVVAAGKADLILTLSPVLGPGYLTVVSTDPAQSDGEIRMAEGGTLTLFVDRLDGVEGDAAAALSVSAGTVSGDKLEWETRESETMREVQVVLPTIADCPSRVVSVELLSADLTVRQGKFTVRLLEVGSPSFAQAKLTASLYKGVSWGSESVSFDGGAGDVCQFEVIDGTLPNGINYGFSPIYANEMQFSGIAKICGKYVATLRIYSIKDGKIMYGNTLTVDLTVEDPASPSSATAVPALCGLTTKSWTALSVVDTSSRELFGTLNLTVAPSGKLSAKLRHAGGSVGLVSSSWDDVSTGDAVAWLEGLEPDYQACVRLAAAGGVSVDLSVPSGRSLEVVMPDDTADLTRWSGTYTAVLIPTNDVMAGSVPLSLRHDGDGNVLWSGYLPGGRVVSGSTRLSPVGDIASLPVFAQTGGLTLRSSLSVNADAEATYRESKDHTLSHRCMKGTPGVLSSVDCALADGTAVERYEAYGQYFDAEEDLSDCLRAHSLSTTVDLAVDGIMQLVSGEVTAHGIESESPALWTVAVNPETGFVGGTIDTLSGVLNWRGVLMNGWTGCGCTEETDLPFVLGNCWSDADTGEVTLETRSAE